MSASHSRAADSTSVIEHRLQIEGRAADHLEHVGGGGLLLQRFAQLVEQARVLDGDDRLGGEVRHQLDLLVGERPHLLAVDADRADQLALLEHRHVEQASRAAELGGGDAERFAVGIGLLGVGIHDVDRLPRAGDTTQAGRRAGPDRSPIEVFRIGRRYAELCDAV